MIGYNHNQPAGRHLVSRLMRLSMTLAVVCAAPAAHALDTGDIVITSVKGEVHVTVSGAERALRAGALLELPATVRTGSDGAIELKQGATTVGVGPDTLLEFPALASPGGSIDRIAQPRGNAFYSIGKRAGHKLRIETPYLVAVVKGTQFNVVAQDGATTISLFEGLLEVRSSDDNGVIDLHAGEIATRSRADSSINVLKMGADKPPPAPPKAAPSAPPGSEKSGDAAPAPKPIRPTTVSDDRDSLFVDRASDHDSLTLPPGAVVPGPDLGVEVAGTVADLVTNAGGAIPLEVVSTPPVSVDAAPVSVAVDTGVAVNASVDPGPLNVDLGVTAAGTGGTLNVNLGLETENDPGNSGKGNSNGNNGNANGVSGNGNGNGNSGNGNGNGGVNVAVDAGDVVENVKDLLDGLPGKKGKKK